MSTFKCGGVVVALLALVVPVAAAKEPAATAAPRVEFRWAEEKVIEGTTVGDGVDLSCTKAKAYLHKTAILTTGDVAHAIRTKTNAKPNETYFIEVTLTKAAAQRMTQSSATHLDKPLVVLVDGKIVAAMVVKSKLADVVPITGYFSDEESTRIVKLFADK